MHLGYHELRNVLNKFKEREKQKTVGAVAGGGGAGPTARRGAWRGRKP